MKKILLHACCAPCLSGTIEANQKKYEATAYWYNPNIFPKAEHDKRRAEFIKLCQIYGIEYLYDPSDYEAENKKWLEYVAGMENEPEGGKRCQQCFEFRLRKAILAANGEKVATTLTVSRHKDSRLIEEVEKLIGKDNFIFIDYKNFDAEKKALEITRDHGIYRQKYCGCIFSMN